MVERTNPKLWEEVKRDMLKKLGGKWNARVAQLSVLEYKKRGGRYKGDKPSVQENSLRKWTEEDWGYAGEEKKSRYLPRKVIEALPSSLKSKENRRKGERLGKNIPYSPELIKIMREKGIL